MEKFEKPKKEKEPIVDVEVDEKILEHWEKKGLKDDISDLVFGFEDLVPVGERFSFHPSNFDVSDFGGMYEDPEIRRVIDFLETTEKQVRVSGETKEEVKKRKKELEEKEDELRKKIILNFAFKELEFNPKNPEVVREEKIKEGDKELPVKYFRTNQPNLLLAYDTIDWWLERKE